MGLTDFHPQSKRRFVARQSYPHSKRQRELGKQQKRQEKLQRKAEMKAALPDKHSVPSPEPAAGEASKT